MSMANGDNVSDSALAKLEDRVRRDLDDLCRPPANWAVPCQAVGYLGWHGSVLGVPVENAVEAGGQGVRLLARRNKMPTVNKMMGVGSFGFSVGYVVLPDEWRWRFMQ